jgi:hypothetical protein
MDPSGKAIFAAKSRRSGADGSIVSAVDGLTLLFAIPEYFVEFSANSPSNLAPTENPFLNPISTPADASNKSVTGAAPVTTKIDPGSASNPAVMFGADQLS